MPSLSYLCPLRSVGDHRTRCETGCMWYNDEQGDCAVNLIQLTLKRVENGMDY